MCLLGLGHCSKRGTGAGAGAGENTAELMLLGSRLSAKLSKTSSEASHENQCYIPSLNTDSEVKFQGHGGQNL